MTHDQAVPSTDAEAHRRIARWLLGASDLLAVYAGDIDVARRNIVGRASSCCGGGWRATVNGQRVDYETDGGPTGSVRLTTLLRLAAASATRGAVDRLTAALAGWAAVHRDEEAQFGPHWSRARDLYCSPEWAAHQQRVQDALRELHAAEAAWWDGQPGIQLDLFGTAS